MQGFAPADESLLFRQKDPKPFLPVCGPPENGKKHTILFRVPELLARIRWFGNSLQGAKPPFRSNSPNQKVDSAQNLRHTQGGQTLKNITSFQPGG
jgi:hypothetical protein